MSENKRIMKKEWTMITKEKQQESIVHGKKVSFQYELTMLTICGTTISQQSKMLFSSSLNVYISYLC